MNTSYTSDLHIVDSLDSPMRIQEYGVGIFSEVFTKSALKKALKKELITINGVIASTATYVNNGDHIALRKSIEDAGRKRLDFSLKVLLEDDHLAIIHKPAGIMVSGNKFMTVANALAQNLRSPSKHNYTKPQPVHRLDYGTTGLLLIGKTRESIRLLNKMFEEKQIEKAYYAIVIGGAENSGSISVDVDEKPSESLYERIAVVPSQRFGKLSLLRLSPKTGRRHQLRKHLYAIGHPILGDKDYGHPDLILKGKGIYLHAHELKFRHPITGERVHQLDELPEKFRNIFPDVVL